MKRRTHSLKRTLIGALTVPLAGAAGYATVTLATGGELNMTFVAPEASDPIVPQGQARMESMIEAGTCWGNDGLKHPPETHVWLNVGDRSSGAIYALHGPKAVHQALEQIFEGVDHGLKPAAFCHLG